MKITVKAILIILNRYVFKILNSKGQVMYITNINFANAKYLHRMTSVYAALLIMSLSIQQVYADIIQITNSNQPSSVSLSANSQSQVVWRVSQRSVNAGQATISSLSGRFYALDGTMLGQNTTLISSSRLTQLRNTTLFVLNETLVIPLSITRYAQKIGSSRVVYQRTFSDSQGGTSLTSTISFKINNGSVASELMIKRIQMQFDDGRSGGIFGKNIEFNASAFLSYKGTGLLDYSWEIASPPSTKGKPIFFPLVTRKQYLFAGGQVTLQSPILPAKRVGTYLVRLKLNGGNRTKNFPVIRYTINDTVSSATIQRIEKLMPRFPLANAQLMPTTEFNWKAITGAAAYQLEIHTKPIRDINPLGIKQKQPITGVLIPASKTRLTIGEVSRSYLVSGTFYYWRVIAINDKKQIIARSEFRRIKF